MSSNTESSTWSGSFDDLFWKFIDQPMWSVVASSVIIGVSGGLLLGTVARKVKDKYDLQEDQKITDKVALAVLNYLMQNPEFERLWNEVEANHGRKVGIQSLSRSEMEELSPSTPGKPYVCDGFYHHSVPRTPQEKPLVKSRIYFVRTGSEESMRATALFEFFNARGVREMNEVNRRINELSENEYSRQIEIQEYKHCIAFMDFVRASQEAGYYTEGMKTFGCHPDLETHLRIQELGGHTEGYRRAWRRHHRVDEK